MIKFKIKKMEEDYWDRDKEKYFFKQNIEINGKKYFFLNNNFSSNWVKSWFPITDTEAEDYLYDYEEGIYIFDFLSIYQLATGKTEIPIGKSRAKFYCPFEIKSKKFATLEKENCFSYLEGFNILDIEKEWKIEINTKILSNEDIEFKVTLFFNNIVALKFEVTLITAEKKEFYNLEKLKEEKEKFERIKKERLKVKKQLIRILNKNQCINIDSVLELMEPFKFNLIDLEEWNEENGFSSLAFNDEGDTYQRYHKLEDLKLIIEIINLGKKKEVGDSIIFTSEYYGIVTLS